MEIRSLLIKDTTREERIQIGADTCTPRLWGQWTYQYDEREHRVNIATPSFRPSGCPC